MPYDRTAPRKRPEDKQVKFNSTINPEAAALLKQLPAREQGHTVSNLIIANLSPDAKKRLIAKLNLALIAFEAQN